MALGQVVGDRLLFVASTRRLGQKCAARKQHGEGDAADAGDRSVSLVHLSSSVGA